MKSSNKLSIVLLTFFILNFSLLIPNCLCQWMRVSYGMGTQSVYSLTFSGNNLYAGTWIGVFLSTNIGTKWNQVGLNSKDVWTLAANGNYLFAGSGIVGESAAIDLSTDYGMTWTRTSFNYSPVISLAVNGANVFAGTRYLGVYLSTNYGASWAQTTLNNQDVFSLVINGSNIFAGGSGVHLSTNNGISWTQSFLAQLVYSLAVNGSNVFAGTRYYGVFLSTNNGTNWVQTSLNNQIVWSLAVNGTNVFAGTNVSGVYVSNNNGANWTQRNEGLPETAVRALRIFNNYIFAGTDSSVYRRPLSELVGIKPISEQMPSHFSLEQNYPNPFNPTTKVYFSLPGKSIVKLIIYDALGKTIAELVNEELNPGRYSVDWDATNFPSGIYFYQMTARDYKETKRMVLLR